jgi:hypothetical protein
MWKQLQALLPSPKSSQLTIDSYGQETCGLPFEQIQEVMEWLGLSLMAAGYQAKAHIIWDSPDAPVELDNVLKESLRRLEPIFLYRCYSPYATTNRLLLAVDAGVPDSTHVSARAERIIIKARALPH